MHRGGRGREHAQLVERVLMVVGDVAVHLVERDVDVVVALCLKSASRVGERLQGSQGRSSRHL